MPLFITRPSFLLDEDDDQPRVLQLTNQHKAAVRAIRKVSMAGWWWWWWWRWHRPTVEVMAAAAATEAKKVHRCFRGSCSSVLFLSNLIITCFLAASIKFWKILKIVLWGLKVLYSYQETFNILYSIYFTLLVQNISEIICLGVSNHTRLSNRWKVSWGV